MGTFPSERTWRRSVVVGRVVAAAVATVLLAACASDEESTGSTTSSTEVEDRTTGTVDFQGSSELCDTQEQCAESLYWAWIAGDRPRADGIATADAVTSLFTNTYRPTDDWQYNGCSGAAGSTGCQWTDRTGRTLTMMISNGTGNTEAPLPPPYEVGSATIS